MVSVWDLGFSSSGFGRLRFRVPSFLATADIIPNQCYKTTCCSSMLSFAATFAAAAAAAAVHAAAAFDCC